MSEPKVTVKGVVTTPYARAGESCKVSPSSNLAHYIEKGYVEVIHEESQQAGDPDQPALEFDDTEKQEQEQEQEQSDGRDEG